MITFTEFFHEVHGHRPYPWQERLTARCAAGVLPSVIAVPTGAGKTTTVDALVWALASQAERAATERTVGVRIVWAIDRRILVDEVHAHAERLAELLAVAREDEHDVLHGLALRLARLAGDGAPPLVATRWRGGAERDQRLHGPLQPQIITSTVAQIASRVLFRGYGVSERSRVVAAGLAGADTTICLDEAHLAEPFRQTVERVREARATAEAGFAVPPLSAIVITATPTKQSELAAVVSLEDDDRAEPRLRERLHGVKRATLVEPAGPTDRERVAALVDATLAQVADGADSVACVVNTVRCALDVHRQVVAALRKDEEIACGLLIGPQRPHDRAAFLDGDGLRLFDPGKPGRRLVVVATQTFEVGLDADVEAMVTESASGTALVQRLGRLNRRGRRPGSATIVRDPDRWLYRDDELAAWKWLGRRQQPDGTIDVSVAALAEGEPLPAPSRPRGAPLLSPELVGVLSQNVRGAGAWQEPDVEVFWRGAESIPSADVSVCWRADLRPELVDEAADHYRAMLLALTPPRAEELLTLTVNAARALVAAESFGDRAAASASKLAFADADVGEETAALASPDPTHDPAKIPFIVLRGDELLTGAHVAGAAGTIGVRAIRPGDVIVLPGRGERSTGFETFPRSDVAGDLEPVGNAAPVRLTPEVLEIAGSGELRERTWRRVARACAGADVEVARARWPEEQAVALASLVDTLGEALPAHPGLAALASAALEQSGHRLGLRRIGPLDADDAAEVDEVDLEDDRDEDEEDDESSAYEAFPTAVGRPLDTAWVLVPIPDRRRERDERPGDGSPPTLDAHARAVCRQLSLYVTQLGVPRAIADALLVAARVHDHGKADPRTQAYYRGGVRAAGLDPIAKSEFGTNDPRMHRVAMLRSGLPPRQRHEVDSVAVLSDALASSTLVLADGFDPELIMVLAGDHHGWGRPVPPVPGDGAPATPYFVDAAGISGRAVDVNGVADGAWIERFVSVNQRYGAWGLAYLQSLLMLADRVVSSKGE
jgi:CRISPR-associated endonuclease/helicase Cas3